MIYALYLHNESEYIGFIHNNEGVNQNPPQEKSCGGLLFVYVDKATLEYVSILAAERFCPCKFCSQITFFLLRKHKFQVNFVVEIVLNKYTKISTPFQKIFKIFAHIYVNCPQKLDKFFVKYLCRATKRNLGRFCYATLSLYVAGESASSELFSYGHRTLIL